MKSGFLILMLGIPFLNGPSDSITLVGSSTNEIEISLNEKVEKSEFIFTNNTNRSIDLKWERKSNSLVKGWDYSVCAYGKCSVGVPEKGYFKTIKSGESGFFALHLFPKGVTGQGKLEIEVFEAKTPELRQLLVFDINVVK